MTQSLYSIWVLEYAYCEQFPESGVRYSAHNEGTRKLPFCYVVIKGGGHTIMVDVGINHRDHGEALAKRYGITNWHSPEEVLGRCGIKPEEVDTVFITHGHFDHLGNTQAFPNAKFYLQERELSKWLWAMSQPEHLQWMMIGTDPADILRAVDLAKEGRLICLEGAVENILPGIDIRTAFDTHTYGCMWVHVRNDQQSDSQDGWVLAGDVVYVYENLVDKPAISLGEVGGTVDLHPIGLAMGSQTNLILSTDEMLKAVNYEIKRVIPIHEERLKDVFPSRVCDLGLRITEVCLGDGQSSQVR